MDESLLLFGNSLTKEASEVVCKGAQVCGQQEKVEHDSQRVVVILDVGVVMSLECDGTYV